MLKIWTMDMYVVRNSLGQYMGSYYARNELHAIHRFLSDCPQPKRWADVETYTAKVERDHA